MPRKWPARCSSLVRICLCDRNNRWSRNRRYQFHASSTNMRMMSASLLLLRKYIKHSYPHSHIAAVCLLACFDRNNDYCGQHEMDTRQAVEDSYLGAHRLLAIRRGAVATAQELSFGTFHQELCVSTFSSCICMYQDWITVIFHSMHLLPSAFHCLGCRVEHWTNNTTIIIIKNYYALAYKSAGKRTVWLTSTPQELRHW